ncbi:MULTISPECIES: hypothetical protein [Aerosakkonema]|uniref:hypothetical protein n=1 Tax=Aerosakkonema TaxID=1246629 RepID=UPI0035BBB6C5
MSIHPVSETTIAEESSGTNSFIELLVLLFCPLKFCLKYKHIYADISSVSISQLKKAVLEGRGFRPSFFGNLKKN